MSDGSLSSVCGCFGAQACSATWLLCVAADLSGALSSM